MREKEMEDDTKRCPTEVDILSNVPLKSAHAQSLVHRCVHVCKCTPKLHIPQLHAHARHSISVGVNYLQYHQIRHSSFVCKYVGYTNGMVDVGVRLFVLTALVPVLSGGEISSSQQFTGDIHV